MLTVICWKWQPHAGCRSAFESSQVNVLKRMVARHYHRPYQFCCITDDPSGIDKDVRIIPLWPDHANVENPLGQKGPRCYRRLKAFSAEAEQLIAPRFVSLDLDCVIMADVTPLWDRNEDFVIWQGGATSTPYNGSMFMLRAGARTKVWESFNPNSSPRLTKAARIVGSDQAWIAHCLGPNEPIWRPVDGVWSFARHFPARGSTLPPQDKVRMVFFPGKCNPWDADVQQKHPWVREHWC